MFDNCVYAKNDVGWKCSRLGEIRFVEVGEVGDIAEFAEIGGRECRPR